MKQTKHKSPTSINPPVVGRFVVVSSPKTNDPLREVTGDIEGTFYTIAQAEKIHPQCRFPRLYTRWSQRGAKRELGFEPFHINLDISV